MRVHARAILVATFATTALIPAAADAQTTGASITQAQQAPNRYLNGQPVSATRPAGLNPTGVNYSDCISDMTLGFPVILSGFGINGNTDGMQIWATELGTCANDTERGTPGPPTCWLVNDGFPEGQTDVDGSHEYLVRVQDLVGPQQAPQDFSGLVHEDASACNAQPSYAGVIITLWFVPLITSGEFDMGAMPLKWGVNTDLVGPPSPVGVSVGAGEGLLTVTWTANADSDTLGYNVFIDPPPGSPAQTTPATQTICPGSSTSSTASGSTSTSSVSSASTLADASSDEEDASLDDAGDATMASSGSSSSSASPLTSSGSASSSGEEAGCYTANVATSGSAVGVCSSTVLSEVVGQDSGVVSGTANDSVDAETEGGDDAGAAATEGTVGGIATIPCQYALIVPACPTGSPVYTAQNTTVTGETNTTYTIRGLTDNVTYAVAVSAVDNSGNPGPPSPQSPATCNYPAPVDDFYKTYRNAGGLAGGGFCALQGGTRLDASSGSPLSSTIAFGALGTVAALAGRRRRGRK